MILVFGLHNSMICNFKDLRSEKKVFNGVDNPRAKLDDIMRKVLRVYPDPSEDALLYMVMKMMHNR